MDLRFFLSCSCCFSSMATKSKIQRKMHLWATAPLSRTLDMWWSNLKYSAYAIRHRATNANGMEWCYLTSMYLKLFAQFILNVNIFVKLVQQSLEVYDTQTVRIRSIRMNVLLPKTRSVRMSLKVFEFWNNFEKNFLKILKKN